MKVQKCKNCLYYIAYYRQRTSHYSRLDHGYCSKCQKQQNQYETCENFKSIETVEKSREKRLFDELERSLTSINEISQIMNEKYNSNVHK